MIGGKRLNARDIGWTSSLSGLSIEIRDNHSVPLTMVNR